MERSKFTYLTLRLLLLCIVISACGIKLIYNRLDWVVPFYIDDYVTLDEDQQLELHSKLTSILSWHRSTQLSAYSDMLRQARMDVSNGLSQDKLKVIFESFDAGWSTLMENVAPHIADMLLTATPEQKKEFFENLKSKNSDYKEKYIDISDKEKRENLVEAMHDNFRDWLGVLSDKQKQIISDYAARLQPIHMDRFQFRLQWQAMLKDILLSDKPQSAVKQDLIRLFAHSSQFYPDSYQNKLDANRATLIKMLMILNVEISKEQFQYLAKRLEYYAVSFEELSRQNG